MTWHRVRSSSTSIPSLEYLTPTTRHSSYTRIVPSGDSDEYVAVHAITAGPEGEAAAINLTFGMSMWIALVIHAIGVEVYLRLTPAESERLRVISYERQLEAGFKNPGSAGLTVDRFGNAPRWHPPAHLASEENMANLNNVKTGSDE